MDPELKAALQHDAKFDVETKAALEEQETEDLALFESRGGQVDLEAVKIDSLGGYKAARPSSVDHVGWVGPKPADRDEGSSTSTSTREPPPEGAPRATKKPSIFTKAGRQMKADEKRDRNVKKQCAKLDLQTGKVQPPPAAKKQSSLALARQRVAKAMTRKQDGPQKDAMLKKKEEIIRKQVMKQVERWAEGKDVRTLFNTLGEGARGGPPLGALRLRETMGHSLPASPSDKDIELWWGVIADQYHPDVLALETTLVRLQSEELLKVMANAVGGELEKRGIGQVIGEEVGAPRVAFNRRGSARSQSNA